MDINSHILSFGEILWDILPDKRVPGGAPMNVALHLYKLGLKVSFVSRIGQDDYGRELKEFLDGSGLNDYYLQEDQQHATGKVQVDLSDSNDPHYNIVFPSAWDFIEYTDVLDRKAKESHLLVYGSLASRNKVSRHTLLHLLDRHDTYNVFDVNLRYPHYTKQRIETLLDRANVVKMNKAELGILSHWFNERAESGDERKQMESLSSAFELTLVCITHGAEGASLYYKGEYYRQPAFAVSVEDAVGSGDAFLAGLLHGLLNHQGPGRMLEYASASGALVASKTGANPNYDIGEVHQLIRKKKQ